MTRHLKLHFVELIASILLVGVYSLLFYPFVWYFDFIRPVHLLGVSAVIIVLNLLYGTIHTWWKHRNKSIKREDAEIVYDQLDDLADEFDTRKPRLVVFKSKVPNAYATDTLPTRPIVALTDNLLETLEPRELKAVMAHEMSHIRSYDIFFMLFLSSFVNVVEYAHNFTVGVFNNADDAFERLIILPFFIITYINITVVYAILFLVSRVREYAADSDAANATSPTAMKNALKRIDSSVSDAPEPAKKQFAAQSALTITPLEDLSSTLFRTHPKTEKRISKLEKLEEKQKAKAEETIEKAKAAAEEDDDETEPNKSESATEDKTPETTDAGEHENESPDVQDDDMTEQETDIDTSQFVSDETSADAEEDTDTETEHDTTQEDTNETDDEKSVEENTDELDDLSEIDHLDDELDTDNDSEKTDEKEEDEDDDDEDDVEYPTDLSLRGDDV